jgi:hypothetical protein
VERVAHRKYQQLSKEAKMLVVNREILLVVAMLFFALVDPTAGQIIHVDDDANVGGNGQTWGTAYKYLQDALAAAGGGDQIWVAEGVYKPDQDSAHPTGTGDRTASFQLKSSVAIYGGFPSGGGNWEERDPNAFETMLSGGIGGELWPDNSYHVVVASGTDSSAILDGLTISFGAAYHPGLSWEDSRVRGGGVYVCGGSATISACTFVWNIANQGGGMCSYQSRPLVTNCIFRENCALSREHWRAWGGGVFCYDSSATIINCVLRNNSATYGGGLFFFSFAAGKVINCGVVDNLASNRGGGMYNSDNSNTKVINCIFSGNCAQGDNGGGLFNSNQSRPSLTNCTLVANQAPNGHGGGLYDFNHSIATLTNCIVWGNIGSSGTDEAAQIDGWPTRVNYSCVQGWSGDLGGVGNFGDDPVFVDPDSNDYHLSAGSACPTSMVTGTRRRRYLGTWMVTLGYGMTTMTAMQWLIWGLMSWCRR